MRPRADAAGGFTLLEVLVALVVLGAVIAGLSQGVRLGLGAWARQAATVGATSELDAVDRTLRTLLAQTGGAPPPAPPPGTRAPPAANAPATAGDSFVGEADTLSCDTVLPSAVASAGRRARIDLLVGLNQRLMLRWSSLLASAATGQPVTGEATLLTGVRGVGFRYYGSPGQGKPTAWYDRWAGATPPELVRVHLVFAKDDPRRWPDIVVASLLQAGAR
jgi:general secretion pathway protein J